MSIKTSVIKKLRWLNLFVDWVLILKKDSKVNVIKESLLTVCEFKIFKKSL